MKLHLFSEVAAFMRSLDEAINALPYAGRLLPQARYYGCIKELAPSGSLPTLWRSLHAARPDDDDDDAEAAAEAAEAAAGGPRFANLVLVVGVWPERPVTGAAAHTPLAAQFWCAALLREPVTGCLRLARRGRAGMSAYNTIFGFLAEEARETAVGLTERQTRDGGAFRGWSEPDILEICSRFRFWQNHRGPKEFADQGYSYEDSEAEGPW